MVSSKNNVRLIGLKSPRSAIGIPTGLRYEYYLNLAPYGWHISSRQAGTKNLDQVRDKDFPSLLQQSREYPIHTWTFVWSK